MDGDRAPISALPSVAARVAAFCAIVVAGLAGGLIGFAVVDIQCQGACSSPKGIGAIIGALFAAGGVAVVAVLVLRAMGEWKTIKSEEAAAAARRPGRRPDEDGDPGDLDPR